MRLKVILTAIVALLLSASATAQYGYGSDDCTDAKESAESAAGDLASYSRRLQQCAENEDFTDDCSNEFRRVKSAHSDYESTVSDVSSYCD